MLNIILFGPPGAGKGTQSEKIIEKYNLIHLSTGDLLRSEMKAGTELGNQAKSYIDNGNLVPDQVVIGMIQNKVESNLSSNGFVFDGFPRTVSQAEALDSMLDDLGNPVSVMLALKVPEEELVQRLLKRGETSGRADDQNEEIIKNRISVYNKETKPVADHYSSQNKYEEIDGVGSIDEIFERLTTSIDKFN